MWSDWFRAGPPLDAGDIYAVLDGLDAGMLDYLHGEGTAAVAGVVAERHQQERRGGLFVAWGITLIIATGVFGGLVRWETDAQIAASAFAIIASSAVVTMAIALYWPSSRPLGADLRGQAMFANLPLDDLKRGAIAMLVQSYDIHVRQIARADRILVVLFRAVVVQAICVVVLQVVTRGGL